MKETAMLLNEKGKHVFVDLPEWYDNSCQINQDRDGHAILIHPERAPHSYDFDKGKWKIMKFLGVKVEGFPSMGNSVKRFDFKVGKHIYSFRYQDPNELICKIAEMKHENKIGVSYKDFPLLIEAFHRCHHG